MNDETRNAADVAIKMEQDSIAFYGEAALKSSNTLGRLMFESLVNDELRHLECLRSLIRSVLADDSADSLFPPRGHSFKSTVSTAFSKARSEIDARVPADASDLKAISIAIDLEKEGYRFYARAASNAASEQARSVYAALQLEEQEHLTFLQNTYDYLENSGDWFLWEEQGLLDGG
ncbi:MAG TPA: ferritin family protein [Planctomycetota bacterium]|nr:ferritin family protein [Planctomycetota bacterium]